MTGAADALIRVESVSVAYPVPGGKVQALTDVSLEVRRGEWLTIIGHNGSGKSTLAKLFNGLIIPGRGSVTVDGLSTADDEQRKRIRQIVGMVFQDPDNQIVATIVEEDVAFGPENLGLPRAEIIERVADAMRRLEIEDLRQRAPHQLSGGQKQRVAIAGVLAMRPAVLVLDESTAMLDPSGRTEVLQAAQALHRDGVTIVAITHFMGEVVLADRVVVLAEGRVALEAQPRDLFAQPERLRELELDVPQVTEIAARLRARGVDVGLVPLTVAELADAYVRLPRAAA
ncbi:MAG TPA: energy-coupling factor transporter ATPase [Chloroflexi bacterium]|nr:energy-coupling factor transporter ATPase [Chloroflexota bacterium]HAL27698.1 energy-coupling factor transporter ATPase [Chloroflexota bacterium]